MLDAENKKKLLTRLKRVEGQVAALRRMVEDDAYCVDVLLQISAAQGALGKAGQLMLGSHLRTCVTSALEGGDPEAREETVQELMDVFSRYGGLGAR
jgi:DNA-binding FrmR family transcriptional regulator